MFDRREIEIVAGEPWAAKQAAAAPAAPAAPAAAAAPAADGTSSDLRLEIIQMNPTRASGDH